MGATIFLFLLSQVNLFAQGISLQQAELQCRDNLSKAVQTAKEEQKKRYDTLPEDKKDKFNRDYLNNCLGNLALKEIADRTKDIKQKPVNDSLINQGCRSKILSQNGTSTKEIEKQIVTRAATYICFVQNMESSLAILNKGQTDLIKGFENISNSLSEFLVTYPPIDVTDVSIISATISRNIYELKPIAKSNHEKSLIGIFLAEKMSATLLALKGFEGGLEKITPRNDNEIQDLAKFKQENIMAVEQELQNSVLPQQMNLVEKIRAKIDADKELSAEVMSSLLERLTKLTVEHKEIQSRLKVFLEKSSTPINNSPKSSI